MAGGAEQRAAPAHSSSSSRNSCSGAQARHSTAARAAAARAWYVLRGDWLWWGKGMRPDTTPMSVKGSISRCVEAAQQDVSYSATCGGGFGCGWGGW